MQPTSSPEPSSQPPAIEKKEHRVINIAFLAKLGEILRLTSLAILFAGSAAIVFAAITLVKIGEAKGLSVSAAATANAPIFLHFSKVIIFSSIILLLSQAIDSFSSGKFDKGKILQYITSALCCICAFAFAFVIAPEMDNLLPQVANNAEIRQSFHNLHEMSRIMFAGIIIFAWLSLILPIFYKVDEQNLS